MAVLIAGGLILGNGQTWYVNAEDENVRVIDEGENQKEISEKEMVEENSGYEEKETEETEEMWISGIESEIITEEKSNVQEEIFVSGEKENRNEAEFTDSEEPEKLEGTDEFENPDIEETIKPDFILTAEAEMETAKAGETLLYTVFVENTGNVLLQNLCFRTSFGEEIIQGIWETQEGELLKEEENIILETGESRIFYLRVPLPEDRTDPVTLTLSASAKYKEKESEFSEIIHSVVVTTEIIPLKADFQVTKTADRTAAVPGDRVFFQICIRNTGERTLHSVLTTEKLQMEEVDVEFLEKEGVILNNTKTKALISRIDPGCSFSLQAAVTIPENIQKGELVNQVEVVTKETGGRVVTSKDSVQIYKENIEQIYSNEEVSSGVSLSQPVSSNPKTGDETEGDLWVLIVLTIPFMSGILILKLRRS